jgi:hypothetical protein
MTPPSMSMAEPRRRSGGLRLAVLLSLAVHGLFALALWALSTAEAGAERDAPLAEVPVVIVPVDAFTVSLASATPPTPKPSAPAASSAEPESDPGPIRVHPLPDNSVTEPSNAVAPTVTGAAPAGSSSGGAAAGGEDTGDGGPAFFGVPVQARSVVYVIDCSISMGLDDALATAKRELLASIARLPACTRFQVLFYNRDVYELPTGDKDGLLPNTPETRQRVRERAGKILAAAGTDHLAVLRVALKLQPDVILFMTDAEDFTHQQVSTVTRLNEKRAVIHTFEWKRSHAEDGPLAALAQFNRGIHRVLRSGSVAAVR